MRCDVIGTVIRKRMLFAQRGLFFYATVASRW